MSLVPILFRDWLDDYFDAAPAMRPSRLLAQYYNRPLWSNYSLAQRQQDAGSSVNVAKDKFQINLDVQQFAPEEISVTANEKCITVEGKHEDRQDEHGFVSRHFVRRYALPEGHDHDNIVSCLSSDGILTVTAPKKALPEAEGERKIPICQTGQPLKKQLQG